MLRTHGLLVLLWGTGSCLALTGLRSAQVQTESHDAEARRCTGAEAKVSAGACADLSVGCGEVQVCCESITDGEAKISVERKAGKTGVKAKLALKEGETNAAGFRGHALWTHILKIQGTEPAGVEVAVRPIPCPTDEKEKIENLLALVEWMRAAVFIRNGKEHTSAEAAEHLRAKYARKKDEIATAKDFIEKAASYSWLSGDDYQIRVAGVTHSSGDYLTTMLQQMERSCSKPPIVIPPRPGG